MQLEEKQKKKKKKKKKKLDENCPPNKCHNGGQCSVRHGNYHCECLLGYNGAQCENGLIIYLFVLFSLKKKNLFIERILIINNI